MQRLIQKDMSQTFTALHWEIHNKGMYCFKLRSIDFQRYFWVVQILAHTRHIFLSVLTNVKSVFFYEILHVLILVMLFRNDFEILLLIVRLGFSAYRFYSGDFVKRNSKNTQLIQVG